MSINRTTANFNLRVPNYDEPQWHVPVDDNWDILDATLGLFVRVSNIRGPWKNATAYIVGDRVVDTVTGLLYETATAHTSASTGTFAEARAASPSLWTRIDQFDTDPSAPSFTIEESDDLVPSVNGSFVNAIDSTIFGPSHAGWVGKGLYTRRTNETQAEYDARVADPEIAEGAVYRYNGPEGFRNTETRTTGFTLTPSYAGRFVKINAATPQNVTFNVGVLRDDQKSHVSGISVHTWGDIFVDAASENVTLVAGSGVTLVWSNTQSTNVIPKGRVVRWVYEYTAEDTVTVYLNVGISIEALEASLDSAVTSLEAQIAAIDGIELALSSSIITPTPVSNEISLSDLAIDVDEQTINERGVRLLNSTPSTALIALLPKAGTPWLTKYTLIVTPDQTGGVSLRVEDAVADGGRINGSSSDIPIALPPTGTVRIFSVICYENVGGSAAKYMTVGLPTSTLDAGILSPAITASGTLTATDHAGRFIKTSGNVTIPVVDGFSVTIIAGGSHDVDAGGTAVSLTSGQSTTVVSDGTTVWYTPVITLNTLPTS